MKPLGGGMFKYPELALRYTLGNNTIVPFSGMDRIEQIIANLRSVNDFHPFNDEERKLLADEAAKIGTGFCRRCGDCLPCVAGIDIPMTFVFQLQYTRYKLKKDSILKR